MAASNKSLAKNTIFLYGGTLVNLFISLYTSRVVLNTLGVVDYGIYSIVGSVIALFTVINMLLVASTGRFLAIEIGRNDMMRLKDTFNSAMMGLVFLSLIVAVILETFGIYMLNSKLVIPDDRMFAAHIVFHLSILSMIITTTQVPYTASISAHEHFGVYSITDILGSMLKLAIVFLLLIGSSDKLILYAILQLAVSFIMTIVYRIYCIRHFDECHLQLRVNRKILVSMLKYSSWNMLGSSSKTYSVQGSNMILNMFFGPVLNAANGIAMTVEGCLVGFSFNVITAFRFQIVKAYASNELDFMCKRIYQASRYSTLLMMLIAIPILFETHFILNLWLGMVPDYSVVFIRILLVASIFRMSISLVSISIGATPYVRNLNIVNSVLYFLQLPVLYFLFKWGAVPESIYYISIVFQLIILGCDLYLLRGLIKGFSVRLYVLESILRNIPLLVIVSCCVFGLRFFVDEGFVRLAMTCVISILLFAFYFYFVVLDVSNRKKVLVKIKNSISKRK